jgi:cysteine desulfurase
MESKTIYLDAAAGERCYPEVIDIIAKTLENHWGNASSDNSIGVDARQIISDVSQYISNDINCNPNEIIWTSGACESNSLAIKGYLLANNFDVDFITSTIEHTSIEEIKKKTTNAITIPVDNRGKIILKQLEATLKKAKPRSIVSIAFANSEIGTIQDIRAISSLVHKYNCILHTDATQYYPWFSVDVDYYGIDMMSVSGQKLGAPRGIGFLYVRNGINIEPLISGSQQSGIRGGTQPTFLITAFGKALEITRNFCNDKIVFYREYIVKKLKELDGVTINGSVHHKLPNNISATINGVSADKLVALCDVLGVILAKGSACKSYSPEPSTTLLNVGLSKEQALSTIRISVSRDLTYENIIFATDVIIKMIEQIRQTNN